MPSHPVQILIYKSIIRKKTKFNGVYSKTNLSKIKDRAYILNCDDYKSIGNHWIALFVIDDNTLELRTYQKNIKN